jgi:molybdopterin/thiamine biosynthesis adenylyltransferase
MQSAIGKHIAQTALNLEVYKPMFYRLTNSKDETAFLNLLNSKDNLEVHDEIHSQIEELIKCRNPKTVYSKESLRKAANEFFETTDKNKYGVWVFYPWSNRLVHILDENEFVAVRTNRNKNKITEKEREILSSKKIGVIGLSVGQSVALTIAMERICGELRIADFDVLELSNLNRIRSGVHNLGIKKTVAVAREIAEIDPFFKVTCFQSGITEENIDGFINENGKLDVLVDECDGLHIKIVCRQKAKKYKVPVVMDTSDGGMIDIERFDLEPNRPILHGLIDHLDVGKVKEAKTNQEKLPFVAAIIGLDSISQRLKESLAEVGKSIVTWPQLASSVTLGGAVICDISRKILLDELSVSGRFFVNVDEIIKD